jgi:DNA-binding CsgD family transcriptional regulator
MASWGRATGSGVAPVPPFANPVAPGDDAADKIERCRAALVTFEDSVGKAMRGYMAGIGDLARGELLFYQGAFAEARQYLLQSLYSAEEQGQFEIENRALFYLLRTGICLGDYNGVREVLARVEERMDEPLYPNRFALRDIVAGWFYAMMGTLDAVPEWLRDATGPSRLNPMLTCFEDFTRARYLYAARDYRGVLDLLENPRGRRGAGAYYLGDVRLEMYRACCRLHLNERQPALDAFYRAWRKAQALDIKTVFLELEGDDLRLFTLAAADPDCPCPQAWLEHTRALASGYVKRLHFIRNGFKSVAHPSGTPGLADNEIEALRLLAEGLSRDEVAETMHLTPRSFKLMLGTVCHTLEASNYVHAIRIALDAGLL